MKIDVHDLESLRIKIRQLQEENTRLKEQLKSANILYEDVQKNELNIEYEVDQGGRIRNRYITDEMVNKYLSYFWGRKDVYALRGSKGGYFPQCYNRWNNICPKQKGEHQICSTCTNRKWKELTLEYAKNHLFGYKENYTDVLGIYPLLDDGTCRLLVFDFDNHEQGRDSLDNANDDDSWKEEVDALRRICSDNGVDALVERSRSGKGAHVWIFFNEFIPASLARTFGFLLLDKGAQSINLKTFQYYDRVFPTQDYTQSIGNTIALPLQGRALKNGNSAFVDENWNAYPDQWFKLFNQTKKISKESVLKFIQKWQIDLAEEKGNLITGYNVNNRPKPWKKEIVFSKEDVIGKMDIVLADGIYVDALNLFPRIQNQIRSMAAFDNPVFYKNQKLGYSNWNQYTAIYLGVDVNDYIKIPRGLIDKLKEECEKANISYNISDKREKGHPIKVSFTGDLRVQQELAAEKILEYDNGVLNAATAFGKTVVSSYLISKRKVNTLILMQSVDLVEQWVEELHNFLDIDEDLPTYITPKGKIKSRKDVIGMLHGSKNTLTGIIDVATIGSIIKKDNLINSYGMVIVDECHHAASAMYEDVLKRVNAKYVYGVSANATRTDKLEKKVFMLIGPIRHKYTSRQRIQEQNIGHYVYPRYTRVIDFADSKNDINSAYSLISKNFNRNEMIIRDIKLTLEQNRTPIILTKYKEHAKYLYEKIKEYITDNVFLLYGDNTNKENFAIKNKMNSLSKEDSLVLVATAQKVGEGFNLPRLDTLMLATPLSAEQLVDQYLGRINRDYEGKESAIVYDYVDSHIHFFNNMYNKRLRAYRKIGFDVVSNLNLDKQVVNHIYNSEDYSSVFEQDVYEANSSVIVCSPELSGDKINRFLDVVKRNQEKGVNITIITTNPSEVKFGDNNYSNYLVDLLKKAGIFVELRDSLEEHFAIIDNEIVWHGGMNLLGKVDIWDNLIRLSSSQVALELMELTLDNDKNKIV